jgi:hypothetical protein
MSARRQSHAAWIVCTLALTWPWSCYADYSNMLSSKPEIILGLAGLLALPTAATSLVIEAIAPRRRVPLWLSIPAGLAAAVAITLALTAGKHHVDGAFFILWFAIPPLVVLALRAAVTDPPLRLGIGWALAISAFALGKKLDPDPEKTAALIGGAAMCLSLWSIAVLVLWKKGVRPEPAPARSQRSELRSSAVAATRRVHDVARPLLNRIEQVLAPAETGLSWWLGAALVFYFGIGAAVAHGNLGGGSWIYAEVQGFIDLFGLPPLRIAQSKQLWWLIGLPWSLVVGAAVWGLAGLMGAFNPGRVRWVRFAAIVFGGALLVWSAMLVVQTGEIRAREEQAAGIHR